ncbi:MerR family transcriptional regulator [Sphaerospermopsis sp. LEGE 00249]|uniref:MerR family transcriptional regulator n=1 Tax=Sphaerospermopsis sp. LEGE 00249 TaxID=1380707 RepID=UPI001C9A55AF|nr:MerR family transcriptional regulator [Sphaerospermopsis sp. LEGE 00249]
MELTGATSNQLQYLERSELIKPIRVWNGKKKPEVYYTWQQILEIRAIRNLRETTSLQVIRKILNFFENYQIDKTLRDKQIVVVNEEVFWVDISWSDFGEIISALKIGDSRGKGIGQYTLLVVPALKEIINEIWGIAKQSSVINIEEFKRRIKDKDDSNEAA